MSKGRKAAIKKLVEELRSKSKPAPIPKGRGESSGPNPKEFKGPKSSGRYRPKV